LRHLIHRPRAVAAFAAAGALALPAAASGHVTLQPSTATAGGFTRLDVRVPNERDDSATTKVDVQVPPGFEFVSYEPRPGWKVTVRRDGDTVSRITWTGEGRRGAIAPGEFVDFGLSLRMPEGKAGDKLTFKALQTHDNGEVVRWIGPEDADEPAPIVTLTEPATGGGHGAPGSAETAAAPAAPAAAEDDGDGVGVAALIVGALGLAAGLAALAASWRRSRVPA
jgi:periplasmic copper chaperone A